MRIAIIGTGNLGRALGLRWTEAGHDVTFGSRDPTGERVQELVRLGGTRARAVPVAEAPREAEVIVLATPWSGTEAVVRALGPIPGRILIDATNPLAPNLTGLTVGHTSSAAEKVAEWAPGARVVKAFNTTGAGNIANPHYGPHAVTMFLCGDDPAAKATVMGLAQEIGLEPVDTGPLVMARYLEPLAMIWISLAYLRGMGPNFALKLLTR
jgi:8-hydroxy-5-deazaflavin:NADPH oxidoreductase